MGWDYEYRIAFGIIVDSWGQPKLKEFLENNLLLGYDKEMSLKGKGTLFVYVKSTYETLDSDDGSYAFSSPNTCGDDFNPPDHPIIHKIDKDKAIPTLTEEEQNVLNEVKKLSNCQSNPFWIRHSCVWY